MSLSFNQISVNIRTPGQYIEFDSTRAVQGLPAVAQKILVIGQRFTAGTVAAGVPTKILSASQAEQSFGRGSMLATMLAALKAANTYTECWAVALDDAVAGALGSGTITLGGAPTETGTLNLYIGGLPVQVAVASGDSSATIAGALSAAINGNTALPFTAAVVGSVVTLTARHKGEVANTIDVRVNYYDGERTPKGLTVAIVAVSGGTTNADVQAAITAIGDEQYSTIICPYTDASNLTKLETLMATRWGPMVQKEGLVFAAVSGSQSTMSTLGDTRNSPYLVILGSGKSPTPAFICAAICGAVDAYEPDPARPRQTLLLPGILAPAVADKLAQSERNLLLYDGISTVLVDAGGNVLIERLITTYRTDAYGVADIAFLNVETMRTLAYLRYSTRARIAQKFPRCKLAADGTRFGPGQPIVTPSLVRSEMVALFVQWEDAGLVEGREQFKRDLIVQRNDSDPDRLDAIIPPDVINQFRVFAAQIQFRL